jgi:hypothetical protein
MKRLALTLCFLLWANPLLAAITYDADSTGTGSTSTSHSATIAADANMAILCLSYREDGGAVGSIATAPTINSQNATFLNGVSVGGVMRVEMWYFAAPPTGTQTVAGTYPAGTDAAVTGIMTFKGVTTGTTAAIFNDDDGHTASSAGSTNADVDSITSAVGEMGVYCGSARTSTTTASADGTAPTSTEQYEQAQASGGGGMIGFGYTEDGAATSINMRVDLSGSVQWTAVGASMLPGASSRRAVAPVLFP